MARGEVVKALGGATKAVLALTTCAFLSNMVEGVRNFNIEYEGYTRWFEKSAPGLALCCSG